MMAIYLAVELLGLVILYGPLRKCLDPEHRYVGRAIIPLVIIGIIFLFPMIGALVPDGPVCWFFQKWGNVTIGYLGSILSTVRNCLWTQRRITP